MKTEHIVFAVVFLFLMPLILGWLYKPPIIYFPIFYILIVAGFLVYKYYLINYFEESKEEPMKKMFNFVKEWWKTEMRTGEELTWEDMTCIEGYWGDERIYGFDVKRRDKQKKLLIVVGSLPRRVIVSKEEPEDSDISPFDIYKKTFGIRPLPSAKIDVEKHPDLQRLKEKLKKVRKKKTEEEKAEEKERKEEEEEEEE